MYGECMWCLWSANEPAESINSGSSCRELMSTTTAVTVDSRAKQETVMGFIYCRKFIPMWVVAITALLVIGPTSAEECRELEKYVLRSLKDFTINAAYGGHVWVHSFSTNPRNTKVKPKVGDPVFNSPQHFGRLWRAWEESDNLKGVHCEGTTIDDEAADCVKIEELAKHKVPTTFSKCTGVDKDHMCDKKSDPIPMKAVKFIYKFKKFREYSGKGWILYDAIPYANSNCK